ncbi:hypothetical protein GVAV_001505 [Gurleya vavrai]
MSKVQQYQNTLSLANQNIIHTIYQTAQRLELQPKILLTATHIYYKILPTDIISAVPACIGLSCKIHNILLNYKSVISIARKSLQYAREDTDFNRDVLEDTLNLEIFICSELQFKFGECYLSPNSNKTTLVILHDSGKLPLGVFFSWRKIVSACLYLAALINEEVCNEKDEEILFIANEILCLYEKNRL